METNQHDKGYQGIGSLFNHKTMEAYNQSNPNYSQHDANKASNMGEEDEETPYDAALESEAHKEREQNSGNIGGIKTSIDYNKKQPSFDDPYNETEDDTDEEADRTN